MPVVTKNRFVRMGASALCAVGLVLAGAAAQTAQAAPPAVGPRAATHAESQSPLVIQLRSPLLSFQQIKGKPEWAPNARRRIANSTWAFSSDNTFTFDAPGLSRNLYPLRGRYSIQGSRVLFQADGRTVTTGGAVFAELEGSIDLTRPTPVLRLAWANGSSYGAVIDNQTFGAGATSAYTATALINE